MQLVHSEGNLELAGANLHLAEVAPVAVDIAPQSQRRPVAQVEQIRDIVADLALDFILEALGDVALYAHAELTQVSQFAFIGRYLGAKAPEIVLELQTEVHPKPLTHADRRMLFEFEAKVTFGRLLFQVGTVFLV